MTTSQWINQILGNLLDIGTIISIIIIIIGALIVLKIGDRILLKIEKKFELNLTAHYLFKDFLKYTVILIVIAWILHLLGIDLQNIILSLGIISVVIGFASKDIVSNFVSGFFVIGDQNIQVGENIEVDGRKGIVTKVGFRNTSIRDEFNNKITIPNSILSTKSYKNYAIKEDYRMRLLVVLPFGLDIFKYKEALDESMKKYDWINREIPVRILAKEMMEYGARVEVSYWVKEFKDFNPGKLIILEETNKIIDEYLRNKNN